MTILTLVTAPDKRLFVCSSDVEQVDDEIRKLFDDMLETMYKHGGIGLAAVQVGEHKRVLAVHIRNSSHKVDPPDARSDTDLGYTKPLFVCNPKIIHSSEEKSDYMEGCLSFPGESSKVTRPKTIKMRYLDYYGVEQVITANGLLATSLQHEIDHTNGVVFVDHIPQIKREKIMAKMRKRSKSASSA
ncbi:peptide deformylase [Rickettsiales bacterium]|nr:peptide deformylase [Rickettsiales bacterium]